MLNGDLFAIALRKGKICLLDGEYCGVRVMLTLSLFYLYVYMLDTVSPCIQPALLSLFFIASLYSFTIH